MDNAYRWFHHSLMKYVCIIHIGKYTSSIVYILLRYPVETHGVRLSTPKGKAYTRIWDAFFLLDLHRGDARRASLQYIGIIYDLSISISTK